VDPRLYILGGLLLLFVLLLVYLLIAIRQYRRALRLEAQGQVAETEGGGSYLTADDEGPTGPLDESPESPEPEVVAAAEPVSAEPVAAPEGELPAWAAAQLEVERAAAATPPPVMQTPPEPEPAPIAPEVVEASRPTRIEPTRAAAALSVASAMPGEPAAAPEQTPVADTVSDGDQELDLLVASLSALAAEGAEAADTPGATETPQPEPEPEPAVEPTPETAQAPMPIPAAAAEQIPLPGSSPESGITPTPASTPEPSRPAEVPEYSLIAPVELHFTVGEGRIGVKAGTRTYAEFQRLARVLLSDLERARRG